MKVVLERQNGAVHFVARDEYGQSVSVDGSPEVGGEGLGTRPMALVLEGLGGCAAIDVATILKKQRQELQGLRVEVTGERVEGAIPAVFTAIDLRFVVKGPVELAKAQRALDLSMDKYCSVAAMLRAGGVKITASIVVEG